MGVYIFVTLCQLRPILTDAAWVGRAKSCPLPI